MIKLKSFTYTLSELYDIEYACQIIQSLLISFGFKELKVRSLSFVLFVVKRKLQNNRFLALSLEEDVGMTYA
jgi:hypothetical protein